MICECCGDRGKIIDRLSGQWIACPKCKGALSAARATGDKNEVSIENLDFEDDKFNVLQIPEYYKRFRYTESTLVSQAQQSFYDGDIKILKSYLNNFIDNIKVGIIVYESKYIHAPNEVDIAIWIYSVQRLAVEKGISTMPYISVKELSYLSNRDENRDLFFAYVNTQLCFLDLGAVSNWEVAGTLADILGLRAKKGLPTIVTGYWSYESIEKNDKSGLRYLISKEGKSSLAILNAISLTRKGKKDYVVVAKTEELNDTNIDDIASIIE